MGDILDSMIYAAIMATLAMFKKIVSHMMIVQTAN